MAIDPITALHIAELRKGDGESQASQAVGMPVEGNGKQVDQKDNEETVLDLSDSLYTGSYYADTTDHSDVSNRRTPSIGSQVLSRAFLTEKRVPKSFTSQRKQEWHRKQHKVSKPTCSTSSSTSNKPNSTLPST